MKRKNISKRENNFTFILDVLDVKCNLPITILPEHIFKKAEPIQVKAIQEFSQNTHKMGLPCSPYEHEIVKNKSGSFSWKPLKFKKDWKYYIIQFKGFNDKIGDLEYISNLSTLGLSFGFTALGKHGLISNPISLVNYLFFAPISHSPKVVTETSLKELGKLYKDFKKIEKQHPEIKRSVQIFHSINSVPKSSDFQILGLFITIESLLTHAPAPNDPTDSLGRQIKSKIPLINHRVDKPISHEKHFGKINEDNLWKKLYGYRSSVAHGNMPDFTNVLKILKNNRTVYNYLYQVTKMLLRQALIEPKLFNDLKKC